MRNNQPFILFTIAFFIIAISPFLLAEGMFMDGMYYAAISHNLADGIGSFWQPQLEATQSFYEHPPLAFGLQALFFRLFGNNIYIDRLYSITTFLVTGLLLLLIWKTFEKKAITAWLPLLLLLCFSLVLWAIPNNMLENTMSIFVMASLLFYLLYKKRKQWWWLVLSGVMLCLAFFTKGPTGLFPLAMPCIYGILFKEKFWHIVKEIGLMLAGLLVPCLLLFIIVPDAYSFMARYVNKQIFGSLQHVITVNTRFFILQKLLIESIPHFIILALLIGYERITKNRILNQTYHTHRNMFWFLIITGLCGVIPIMISLKQRGFYMLPAFPIFALAWALLFETQIQQFIQHISRKIRMILYFISLLLMGTGVFSIIWHSGSYSRDAQLLSDIKLLLPHIPAGATISMDRAMFEEWNLHAYFARYKHISLDVNNEKEMLLMRDSTHLKNYHNDYALKCQTETLLLYEKR
jgi:4-amino-4-deoxy-L-arabinose transferase-like glycosyltransferase